MFAWDCSLFPGDWLQSGYYTKNRESFCLQSKSCASPLQPTHAKSCNFHFEGKHSHTFQTLTTTHCGNETETSWYLPCKLQVIMCYRSKQFQSTVSLINRSNQRFTDICLDLYEWSHRAATYKPVREFTFFCCGCQQVLPDALPPYSKQFCVSNFMRTVHPSLSQYDCWCVPKKAGSWNFWVLSQSWNLEFPFDLDFPPGKSEKTQQPRVNNPRWRHWTVIKL